jgi:hypothetical protein
VLRTVPAFPDAPSAQARLSDGLEGVLGVATERLGILKVGLSERRRHSDQLDCLTEFLADAASGHVLSLDPLWRLADQLVAEATQAQPLRVLAAPGAPPARLVACHGINVAQVIARLVYDDAEWFGRAPEAVLAALLHDIGMVTVPLEILRQPGPLTDEQRRRVEQHARDGAQMLERIAPGAPWLIEAAQSHHERSDGTGYPDAVLEMHVSPLVRLLTVCDVYAALRALRPYRAAAEPRAALTDTLLLADQNAVGRAEAERLLRLGFFPVGSVVELSDGALAVVVAPPLVQGERIDPARPVVAVLCDKQGLPAAAPRHVDLTREGRRAVLRLLAPADRRELLGKRYPLLVA